MADLKVSLGLDSQAFERELHRSSRIYADQMRTMEQRTASAATRMERSMAEGQSRTARAIGAAGRAGGIALAAVTAVLGIAKRAMENYAKEFPHARAQSDALARSTDQLSNVLGRSLAHSVFPDIIDRVTQLGEGYRQLAIATVHGTTVAREWIAAVKEAEALDRSGRGLRTLFDVDRDLDIREARERVRTHVDEDGQPTIRDQVDLRRLELDAELRDYRDSLEPLFKSGQLTSSELEGFVDRRKAMNDRELEDYGWQLHREEVARWREEDTKRLDDQDRNRQTDESRRDSMQRQLDHADDADAMLEIEKARAEGLERQADALQVQLDLRRELRDIAAGSGDQAFKDDLAQRARDRASARTSLLDVRQDEERPRGAGQSAVLGAGVASIASVRAVVFGGGGDAGLQVARSQNKHLESIAASLNRIERRDPAGVVLT